ncbi:dTDP-4-dehydrorhamnose 3,5-epimerase [Streptomyces naphthomycinicus]|uniref:dTDP-4-dehydrorhamnose 3,5-epimerase n=1 Tax=Streptomyces naphthomycinicus TaxID=2872625 RepID=UPI001CEC3821|nr:dTDP-4-dehydrorhamnose 3,5-epimerase [Streptomyces sp. TML10]
MRALGIEGAWVHEPQIFDDARGSFHEWFRPDVLHASTGRSMSVAQANRSVSRRGVVRGIHYSAVPPGQAKYVTCVRGAVLDVVVDLRTGSPTFARWEAIVLDDRTPRSVFLAEGLGHGFAALTDDATVVYLCSTPYVPEREHGIDPFDGDLAIRWPTGTGTVLSERDRRAPSLAEAHERGLLPRYAACTGPHRIDAPAAHVPADDEKAP